MLKGRLVLLRPVKRSDLGLFVKWFNDTDVTEFLDSPLPLTEMAEEKNIEAPGTTRARTDVAFVVEEMGGDMGKPIGWADLTGIDPKDQSAMFGIVIGEKGYRGHGYGTEAARLITRYGFEQLNLHRISSRVAASNERSLRLHRAIGFREEARQRDSLFRNGRYHDHVLLGRLRDEWTRLASQAHETESRTEGGTYAQR